MQSATVLFIVAEIITGRRLPGKGSRRPSALPSGTIHTPPANRLALRPRLRVRPAVATGRKTMYTDT
jgi:hypothetical protein